MLHFLPAPLLGALTLVLITANTVVVFVPLFAVAIVKLAIPIPAWRRLCTAALVRMAEGWIGVNNALLRLTQPIDWDLRGVGDPELSVKKRYLVVSNHQSWADVLVLQRALNRRIPFLRFFVKQELIWVPLLGLAWWALDLPFMKRYSKQFLEKHPELKGKDLETTRRACEHFRYGPISVMNFLEGTRFTPAKHDRQRSPFRHLLRPKAGGVALVLDALGGELDTLVDITIVYPGGTRPTLWQFCSGAVSRVVVDVHRSEIPADVRVGDYENDEFHRARVQAWVRGVWERKDALFAEIAGLPEKREAA